MSSSSSSGVHIVLSDTGWVLERHAAEITKRLDYVTYGLELDPRAYIQYFMTYARYERNPSPISIALFTHKEASAEAGAKFDQVANDVDFAISMSNSTDEIVANIRASKHSCIQSGVDLEAFTPVIKVAVVGRTYHTGRKGEALVRAVQNITGIDWFFTGQGWPGPALNLSDKDLPEFYRSMDYILVPSVNEGGPMCVIEALACGIQVIAPNVGWVEEFPHIGFDVGSAESLRQVLLKLVKTKFELRAAVTHLSWDNWADNHDRLFRQLISSSSAVARGIFVSPPRSMPWSVGLITHGLEELVPGGPSVRVPRTVSALRNLGVEASRITITDQKLACVDLIHGFNLWPTRSSLQLARQIARIHKPFVFSPIFLDLSEYRLWNEGVPNLFRNETTIEGVDERIRFCIEAWSKENSLATGEFFPGYLDEIREIIDLSEAVVFLSDFEREKFNNLVGRVGSDEVIIKNPVDAAAFDSVDPDLFRKSFDIQDYVLCVARIEPRKNQLMLCAALREVEIPVVLVGQTGDYRYLELVKYFGGPNVTFTGRLETGSQLLLSAIKGARVFALPSWSEGAPLSALEAAAAGRQMVLSNKSSEREYFGTQARYCDPADLTSIRQNVVDAWAAGGEAPGLSAYVRNNFSYEVHAEQLRDLYNRIGNSFDKKPKLQQVKVISTKRQILVDLTTWAYSARQTEIVLIERAMAVELAARLREDVRFIIHCPSTATFAEIPREIVCESVLKRNIAFVFLDADFRKEVVHVEAGSQLVIFGSAWMEGSSYITDLADFGRRNRMEITAMVHDTLPESFPQWFPIGYSATWSRGLAMLIARSDRLVVYSNVTRIALEKFCQTYQLENPCVHQIKLGNTSKCANTVSEELEKFIGLKFVLSIGDISPRKNYQLIYDVWVLLESLMGNARPHLVIVGEIAWNGTELAHLIRVDPRVNSHIHIINGTSDGGLEWLYRNCLFSVYPSHYEGWGFPVAEALAHGKICLTSKSSSLVEISPSLTDFLEPMDRAKWAAMIQHYATSETSRLIREREIRETFVSTPWSIPANQLISVLDSQSQKVSPDRYNWGRVVFFGTNVIGDPYAGIGWYPPEPWGRWATSRRSALKIEVSHSPDEDLMLVVLGRVLKKESDAVQCSVMVNDLSMGRWEFPAFDGTSGKRTETLINSIRIPMDVARARAPFLDIVFEVDQLTQVTDLNPSSEDLRHLGLGLLAFSLTPWSIARPSLANFDFDADVAGALNLEVGILPSAVLSASPIRQIIPIGEWISQLSPYNRLGGSHHSEGGEFINGRITLQIGTSNFDPRKPLGVNVEFAAQEENESELRVGLFINGKYVQFAAVQPGCACSFSPIAAAYIWSNDPVIIALVDFRGEKTGLPLRVSKFMISQEHAVNVVEPYSASTINPRAL